MYRSARVAITAPEDTVDVFLGGSDQTIPIISFGAAMGSETFEISLNSHLLTVEEQAAWLRRFAHQLTSLAELLDVQPAPAEVVAS